VFEASIKAMIEDNPSFGSLGRVETPFPLRCYNGLVLTSRKDTALVRNYGLRQEFIAAHSLMSLGPLARHGSSHSRMAWCKD